MSWLILIILAVLILLGNLLFYAMGYYRGINEMKEEFYDILKEKQDEQRTESENQGD